MPRHSAGSAASRSLQIKEKLHRYVLRSLRSGRRKSGSRCSNSGRHVIGHSVPLVGPPQHEIAVARCRSAHTGRTSSLPRGLGTAAIRTGPRLPLVLAWRHDVLSRLPVDLSRPIGSSGDGSRATRVPPVSRAESVRHGELDGLSLGLLTFGRPARGERRPCGDEQVRRYDPSVRRSSTGCRFPNDKWSVPGTLLTLSDRNVRGKRRSAQRTWSRAGLLRFPAFSFGSPPPMCYERRS